MGKPYVETLPWTIGTLVDASRDDDSKGGRRIEIPRFQRYLVWGKEQRETLIDSIHRGYPIGSLLVYERVGPGRDVFQVVDGLQRTSTLVEYSREPLLFAPESLFPSTSVDELAQLLSIGEDHARRAVKDWMRRTKRLDFEAGYSPDGLAQFLREDLDRPLDEGSQEPLRDILASALDTLRKAVDIDSVSIPVVIFRGDESELPTIFERINQRGTKLNKYEVFAATWLNSATQVNDQEIRKIVNDKYAALIDSGFSISGLERDQALQDFNLFEYLFGFGKVLVRRHGYLFRSSDEPTETEPAAFSVMCISLGQQLAQMGSLPSAMPKASDGLIDPSELQSAIMEAATAVQTWLKPFIGLRLNAAGDNIDYAHGELQIVSMIARAVTGRWDTRTEAGELVERPGWKDDWSRLEVAMPQHYLMDVLEETWRGPIYSTVFNRVWAADDDTGELSVSPHYSTEIERSVWENALNVWFDKQMARQQRTRSHVRSVDRVLLRFIYSDLVTFKEDQSETFELEHLFPVARLKDEIPDDGPGWPISCVSNLALFTQSLNREKSAQTISEYLKTQTLSGPETKALERLLLCDASEVAIPADGLELAAYERFLRDRWKTMQDELLRNLRVN